METWNKGKADETGICGNAPRPRKILDTVIPRAAAILCLVRDLVPPARGICFLPSDATTRFRSSAHLVRPGQKSYCGGVPAGTMMTPTVAPFFV
jgi:hypothetical protein